MPGSVMFLKRLPAVRAVEFCRLDLLGGDAFDRRGEHHDREAGLHPDHHDDQEQCVHRWRLQPEHGFPTEPDDDLVQQADLVTAGRAVLVDELPDDAGADERDGERHEDERLVDALPAGFVDEDRVRQTDAGGERRDEEDPDHCVAQRDERFGLGEHPDEVVEPDELARAVHERGDARAHGGIDEPDGKQDDRGRQEQRELQRVPPAFRRPIDDEEDQADDREEDDGAEQQLDDLADEISCRHGRVSSPLRLQWGRAGDRAAPLHLMLEQQSVFDYCGQLS